MTITDFDVEPAVGPRFWARLLGIAGLVTGVLAIIGWPLPIVSGRGSSERHAWARTVQGVQDWMAHDGWRMSGSSWAWGGLAVLALGGVVAVVRPAWNDRWRVAVVVVPGGVLLVPGPLVQWAVGAPYSNYGLQWTGGTVVGIAAVCVGGALFTAFRRLARREARQSDDVNPPPRGPR